MGKMTAASTRRIGTTTRRASRTILCYGRRSRRNKSDAACGSDGDALNVVLWRPKHRGLRQGGCAVDWVEEVRNETDVIILAVGHESDVTAAGEDQRGDERIVRGGHQVGD